MIERTYTYLNALTREQLIGRAMHLYRRIDKLEQWQLDVLELNSNIGLDVDRIRAIRMKEHFDKLTGVHSRPLSEQNS